MDVNKELKAETGFPYLLAAPSGKEGCKRAHVSNAAVYKWLKNEIFKGELRREPNAVIGWRWIASKPISPKAAAP
jgi:hypothetical protein